MDGNSKLLRDRIFAQLSFTLSKGSLQLVIGGGGALGPHPLLEVEVMQYLTCELNTYLSSSSFSLSLSFFLPLSLSLSPSLSLSFFLLLSLPFPLSPSLLQLSSLASKVDYRPRLKYSSVEVLLKGLSVTDHYHYDTHYPTLVQPNNVRACRAIFYNSLSLSLPLSL